MREADACVPLVAVLPARAAPTISLLAQIGGTYGKQAALHDRHGVSHLANVIACACERKYNQRMSRDVAYMLWVKTQPCAARWLPGAGPCTPGFVEAAHTYSDGRALSAKSDDAACIPLCMHHHRIDGLDTYSGPFRGWSLEQRRTWVARIVEETRARYEAEGKYCW